MRRKILCLILITIFITFLIPPNISFGKNNIALCYHGIVTDGLMKSSYMSHIDDFKEQINYLKDKGYTFVKPSKYYEWYNQSYIPDTPIATIIFDDARENIDVAANWLIQNEIPFGVAVIGRRLGEIAAEEGYTSWITLQDIYNSGYCEVLTHSYNIHDSALRYEDNSVVASPIMEGPCYLDNGEFIYIDNGDSRWYWDASHIDKTTWSFPLFGTDQMTGNPITSTIKFKATKNITVNKLRVWASLHLPYSSGYNANVRIEINDAVVANKTINTNVYDTHSQWPERQFITIDFDNSYALEENKTYTIKFITDNVGNAAFRVYSIPDFSGNYELTTTCTDMTYKENELWPAKACVILADDNGSQVSDVQFQEYINNDLNKNNDAINKYLTGDWDINTTGFDDNENLECIVLGGTYSDGSLANTNIKFIPQKSFVGEVIRLKSVSNLGKWYPLIIDIYIDGQKVSRFSPNWNEWKWQTINIDPYQFIQGEEYNITFKTMNRSLEGIGLVRIYADQQDLPWPSWDEYNQTWTPPDLSKFEYDTQFEVSSLEGTDVYPDGINIYGVDYTWEYSAPYSGPGRSFLEILSCSPQNNINITQICYPFGSYYSQSTAIFTEDLHDLIKNILTQIGINSGFAVWDEDIRNMENVQNEYSEFVIPRYLIKGNVEQSKILEDISSWIGEE